MANKTPHLDLNLPLGTEISDQDLYNENFETLDTEVSIRLKSINGIVADPNGDAAVNSVPFADNLNTSLARNIAGSFIFRTAAGDASIESGDAWLMNIKGNNIHDGYVAESIDLSVNQAEGSNIEASIDRDTFVAYVQSSGTYTIVYTSAWSTDPSLYGISIEGTPVSGDSITIVYVKEVRGTIYVANPQTFVATGWNLYNNILGYARVIKYNYGYMISGSYTNLQYSATVSGMKSAISITDGHFDVPADGYVWVTGGNSSDTAIWPTWSDWTDAYDDDFTAYTQTVIDLSSVMSTYFPYGLLKAGSVMDEINLNLAQAIQRVERMTYNATNLATAKNSGREYEYDENFIYLTLASAVVNSVSIDGSFTANDHGIEFFTDTEIPVQTEILYGNNLKNKLERDILTISQQTLTAEQKTQVRSNIDAMTNTPETFTLSGSDRITITDQNCMKFGRIVIGSVRFSVDTAISVNQMVINGLPIGQSTLGSGYSFGACASSRASESFTLLNLTSGTIYSGTAIATGNVMLSFCYIAKN